MLNKKRNQQAKQKGDGVEGAIKYYEGKIPRTSA